MSICSVPNCKLQSELKFPSPRNEQQLSLWKRILSIGENKFFVCESHFEERFVRIRKLGVTSDAYPSMYLGNIDEDNADVCQCCLKSFLSAHANKSDEYYKISSDFQSIFKDVMECELPSGIICSKCHEYVSTFNTFRTNIRKSQRIRENIARANDEAPQDPLADVKQEPTDDDDEVEIMELEQERISVASDDEENENDESVIRFVEHPDQVEIKREKIDGEDSQDSGEMAVTTSARTYSKRPRPMVEVKTEKEDEDENPLRIKEEPLDDDYDFQLPASSLFVDLKTLDDFTLPPERNKRTLADSAADAPSAPKSRRIVQGSSPYTSSLPLKSARRAVADPASLALTLKCQYCPERFSHRDEILVHIQEMHNFTCPTCPANFPYKITLIQHQMSEHAGQASEQTGRLPVAYRHTCPVCKLKFASAQSLSGHMKQKHKMDASVSASVTASVSAEAAKDQMSLSQRILSKFSPSRPRSALITVKKEVDTETLTEVHNNLNGIPCADCGLLYKPNKLERHRMEKHNKH